MMIQKKINSLLLLVAIGSSGPRAYTSASRPSTGPANFCPPVYRAGVLGPFPFTTAFSTIGEFDDGQGGKRQDMLISSFFNSIKDPNGTTVQGFFEDDLVARITDLANINPDTFNPDIDFERLTDLNLDPSADPVTVWPNDVDRAPDDGFLDFEAVVVPQGFHSTPPPGRLSLIKLDDLTEYIVDKETIENATLCTFPPIPGATENSPRSYHQVKYVDMDLDGWLDLVTVRYSFKLGAGGTQKCFTLGEVVWFRNPTGDGSVDPTQEWDENIIIGFPDSFDAAEVFLDVFDFEGDGIPEIVGTHLFTSKTITIYGAPKGKNWTDVDPTIPALQVRSKAIMTDQGIPFEVEIIDLNRDGKVDILTSNHQNDDCNFKDEEVPGRVLALEQPTSGDIFNDDWPIHILKDNIRPNPTAPDTQRSSRLAPGRAKAFWTKRAHELGDQKPWIVVGGDEASKVWLLKPRNMNSSNWEYKSAVLFDINDYYGPGTTQNVSSAPPPSAGNSISTIGGQSIRYDSEDNGARAEIFVPVFEARDIHIFSFRPQGPGTKVHCPPDVRESCPISE